MAKVIDLFSGAGGLSLGAARAGFEVSASVEIDEFALETHTKNFPETSHISTDVSKLSGQELLRHSGLKSGQLDGLIGGPPCQGFSSIGRRNVEDQRNNLFDHFFRLVKEIKPKFFIAENVPGILDDRYDSIRSTALGQLPKDYHLLPPTTIQANLYGAPTIRTRVFFIGFLPSFFQSDLTPDDFLPPSSISIVKVGKALEGLPLNIDPTWLSAEQGWQPTENLNERDPFFIQVTNNIPKGVGHQPSINRYLERGQVSGCMGTRHTPEVMARFAATELGRTDPISRAVRLDPTGFCPTLRAGTSKERGSYQAVRPIHYMEPRVITPREAARLQGFPDWFIFHDTKWHSFRQIGNSVSPIVAHFILSKVFQKLH